MDDAGLGTEVDTETLGEKRNCVKTKLAMSLSAEFCLSPVFTKVSRP